MTFSCKRDDEAGTLLSLTTPLKQLNQGPKMLNSGTGKKKKNLEPNGRRHYLEVQRFFVAANKASIECLASEFNLFPLQKSSVESFTGFPQSPTSAHHFPSPSY